MRKMIWGFTGRPATMDAVAKQFGPGWAKIVEKLVDDLFALGWDGEVYQAKEKFGGLRFYIGCGSDEVFKAIDAAEAESYRTCEECGEPGEPNGRGWMKTLCEKCDREMYGDEYPASEPL